MTRTPSLPDQPRRIVVRGVNWLGDAVMTTPALIRMRERFPDASIALVCAEKLAGIWERCPALDEVIPFAPAESVVEMARRIRKGRFDLGVLFPNSLRAALELRLAGVPNRIGYAVNGRSILLTHPIPPPPTLIRMRKRGHREVLSRLQEGAPAAPIPLSAHHVHHYLHLASSLGVSPEPCPPQLTVGEDEVRAFLSRHLGDSVELHSRPRLGLNPGAEYGPAKRWPISRFAETAAVLIREQDIVCLIFGGPSDRATAEALEKAIHERCANLPHRRVVNLAGVTTLRELMAGTRSCAAFLTNDSGPMHVAAAVGTRVVAPFGSTSPELTGPGLPGTGDHVTLRNPVPCSPCFLRICPIDFRCLNGIPSDDAIHALRGFLKQRHFR